MYILFLIWSVIYMVYVVDLSLFPVLQHPAFFTHVHFFKTFTTYPGGIVAYCARYLTILCTLPWLCAAVKGSILIVITLLTDTFLRIIFGKKIPPVIALLPAILLIVLHGNYGHRFVYDIDLLLSLTFYLIYRLYLQKNIPAQIIFQLLIAAFLLYTGGIIPYGLFILTLLIDEIKTCKDLKQTVPIIFTVTLIFLLPYLYYDHIFMGSTGADWQLIHELLHYYKVPLIPILLFLFYPLCSALMPLITGWIKKHSLNMRKPKSNGVKLPTFLAPGSFLVQILLITILVVLSHLLFHDVNVHMLGLMQRYAYQKDWDRVIATAAKCYPYDNLVYLMRNRALYHKGKLLDHLFDYPQLYGIDGLMYKGQAKVREYTAFSDIAYDMGEVNQALRWSYELIANTGYAPYALKRIAFVNLVKGNYATVEKMLNMLVYAPFQKKWVADHRRLVTDRKLLEHNREIMEKRSLLPEKLYSSTDALPYMSFLVNLFFNKKNRMAYEYLLATLLLDNDLDEFIKYVRFLNDFGYRTVPRHIQEALLLYGYNKKQPEQVIRQFNISQETVTQFKKYKEEWYTVRDNYKKAEMTLRRGFGNTFWYYQQFIYPHISVKRTGKAYGINKY